MNFTSDELNMIYDAIETKMAEEENNMAFLLSEEEFKLARDEISKYEQLLAKIKRAV